MFSCIHSPQKFASIQASIDKLINSQALLSGRSIFKLNRDAARTEWCLSLILYERVYQSALMPRLFCLKAPLHTPQLDLKEINLIGGAVLVPEPTAFHH